MKKTGIFFDFDGTLFYGTTDINYYSINLALQDMNRPPISREEANTTVGDRLEDACRGFSIRTIKICAPGCCRGS